VKQLFTRLVSDWSEVFSVIFSATSDLPMLIYAVRSRSKVWACFFKNRYCQSVWSLIITWPIF